MYYYRYPWPYYVQVPALQYGTPPVQRTFLPEKDYGNENKMRDDYGSYPYVVNINEAAKQNQTFRTALWTGDHLQVTVMSIPVGSDIGLEVHPDVDQFLRMEDGEGLVRMGDTKENIFFQRKVFEDDAVMVPAGTWHNLINTGYKPLKLYTIYAPPEHPFGTIHYTKNDAAEAENHHG
ncbi:cupin domain-containing protein [Salibacterium sp. K-3]